MDQCGRGSAARGRDLAFEKDRDGDRGRQGEEEAKNGPLEKQKDKKKRPPAPEVGNALRAAYEQTVSEDIPPEMLDLLGKLG